MKMVYGFVFEKEKIGNNMGPIMVLWGVRDSDDFFPFPSGFLDERDAVKVFQEMLSTKMCFFFQLDSERVGSVRKRFRRVTTDGEMMK
jgi:hypothetical protein